MNVMNGNQSFENRTKGRKPYSGPIFFATKNGFHEGRLENFSPSGLFIKTNAALSIGEIVTIALPYLNAKQAKYQGQVLWNNREGVGIELFKKRGGWNDYIRLH
jgi:Tfp pilus assembly protein PilZ